MSYRVLVTGTSSGFGKLTAEALARAGHRVFAGMRDPSGKNASVCEELEGFAKREGAKGSIEVVEFDVKDDLSVQTSMNHIATTAGGLDVLVNNAGVVSWGILETFTAEQARDVFETNVVGLIRTTRAALPLLRQQGGLVVHLSSTLGRYVIPFMGVYTASKFAVEALADAYRYELAPLGVESVLVQPGAFPTNIMRNMQPAADPARSEGYGGQNDLAAGMAAGLGAALSGPNAPNPQDVADAIVRIVDSPAGKRPVRTIVDNQVAGSVEQVNQAAADAQAQIFAAMGLSHLLTTTAKDAK